VLLLVAGCAATFDPRSLHEVNLLQRAQTQTRGNLTGDPYFTDGFRAVMWVSSQPSAFDEVDWFEWELPEER
jgi:hypothetical protein